MPDPTPCRSCGAPMIFVRTVQGALMPLDAEPVEDGNIYLDSEGKAVIMGSLFDGPVPDGPRYVSHYATCKDAKTWRKRKPQ